MPGVKSAVREHPWLRSIHCSCGSVGLTFSPGRQKLFEIVRLPHLDKRVSEESALDDPSVLF